MNVDPFVFVIVFIVIVGAFVWSLLVIAARSDREIEALERTRDDETEARIARRLDEIADFRRDGS